MSDTNPQPLPNTTWATGSDRELIPVPDPIINFVPDPSSPWAMAELSAPKRPLDRIALTPDENQFVLDLRDELEAALASTYLGMPVYAHLLSDGLAARLALLRLPMIEHEISKLYQLKGWEGVEFSGSLPALTVNITYHYRSRRGI